MAKVSEEFKTLVSELFYSAQEIPSLVQLIIYGSVARGEEERSSDVDILLIFSTKEDPEKMEIAKTARKEIANAFAIAKCDRGAQITMTNLEEVDEVFMQNISSDGIVVWGRPFFIDVGTILNPMVLFEYRVGGESDVEKVRFYRGLKSQKYIKVKNGIIVSGEGVKDAENIFKINHIEYKKSRIWLP